MAGHSVNDARSRATRPPSWSIPTHKGVSRASPSTSNVSSATCSGASTLRANSTTPPRSHSRASARSSTGTVAPPNPAINTCPT